MAPTWLTMVSYAWFALSASSLLIVLFDLPKQNFHMKVMKVVWPLTTLYMGPLGLLSYWRFGRGSRVQKNETAHSTHAHYSTGHAAHAAQHMQHCHPHEHAHHHAGRPFWQSVFVSSTHCGAGCALGDLVAEVTIAGTGLVIASSALVTSYIADFVLAFIIGIAFQYVSIVPMQGLRPVEGIQAALKADTASLAAFEVGMFAWMAISRAWLGLSATQPAFWFMMQIAMMVGFATSYPATWVLVRKGVKHAM